MGTVRSEATALRPQVSVIVPVFNTPIQFLNECIDSVLAQEFCNYELIVVDDGSDTKIATALDGIAQRDERIILLRQANQGVSMARNAALDVARGDYVTFLDSDDTFLPGALELLTDEAKTKNVAIATAGVIMNPDRKTADGQAEMLGSKDAIVKVFRQQDYAWNNGIGGKIFERRLFDSIRFNPNRYEDLEAIPRLYLLAEKISYAPYPVYLYRQHPTSFSGTVTESRFDILKVLERLRTEISNIDPTIDRALDDRKFSAACNIVALLARTDNSRYKAIENRAWEIIKRYRRQILLDRHSRIKNRLGALTAFFGLRFFRLIARVTGV